jgi:hypothetical protein
VLASLGVVACSETVLVRPSNDAGARGATGTGSPSTGGASLTAIGGPGAVGSSGGAATGAATGTGGRFEASSGGSALASGGSSSFDACVGQDIQAEALPVDMYIMFDRSSSMVTEYPGSDPPTTWWATAQKAVTGFVQIPAAVGLGVGIQYFPQNGVDPQSCDVGLYETPDVPIALLPGNAAAITQSIDAHMPEAFTPTGPALTGAIDYMKSWGAAHPGRQPVVVLVTDGYPTECPQGVTVTDIASIAKAGFEGTPKIPTFIIGFADGGALDNLDSVAKAGGTIKAFQISGGDLGAQFTQAMLSITTTPLSCNFNLPATGDASPAIDLNLVSVHYIAAATRIDSEVPKVDGLGGCAKNANTGWYFDDPAAPVKILLCPGTCSNLGAGSLSIEYGCISESSGFN